MHEPQRSLIKPYLARLLLGTGLGLAAILLACGLTLLGAIWLIQGLTLWLSTLVGEAGAHAITGLLCMLPLVLVGWRLWRMSQLPARPLHKAGDTLRDMVRENPWEAIGVAFLMGVTQHGAHTERLAVLRDHLRELRQRPSPSAANDDGEDDQSRAP